jgi:nucleoside-diphosphate-sugar epimerase
MIGITGGSGFVGLNLIKAVQQKNIEYRSFVRAPSNDQNTYFINSINGNTNWSDALNQVKVLIHIASIAHGRSKNPEDYKNVNYLGTVNLAKYAASVGVKRFIFISTIGVNGTSNSVAFNYSDNPEPSDDYSVSKYDAEVGLNKIAKETGMEVVIIRPPLVYGINAPGNFGILLKMAKKNLPLPLGSINNERSFVSIDNLIDLVMTCIDHKNASNRTFLVSDDENISTSNFLKKLTLAGGKKPRLLPMPVSYLRFLSSLIGKKSIIDKFSCSLTVDIEYTKKTLNWKPPITLSEGILRCFK